MTAGVAGIFSADPAMAQTRRTGAQRRAGRQASYINVSGKASPDCCTTCTRDEGNCGVAHCANGGCCFHCDGCDLGTTCLPVSCSIGTTITYCP
jgi:hypothetical protein